MKRAVIGMVVFAMCSSPAFARGRKAARQTKAASDQTFVMKAAKGGMAEVELGKLAAQKGSSDQVKQFGQKMADDHSKANDELKSIASSKNITLPSDLDPKDQALRDRLSKLSGPAFDRAYMQAMVRDHRMDVNEFKRESTSGRDAEVKAFAAKTLPTLEDHLKQAETTSRAVVGTSGTVSPSANKPGSTSGQSPATSGKSSGTPSSTPPTTPDKKNP